MLSLNNLQQEPLDQHKPEATPSNKPTGEKNAGGDIHRVYSQLRRRIIAGEIAPGQVLNQVHIARDLGVSRTPVREALRILQTESLVETNHQHRVRVTEITPAEVDSVYATWIVVQALGTALTVPHMSERDLEAMRQALEHMTKQLPSESQESSEWDDSHVNFHRCMVMHAGPMILETIESCWSRSERARRTYMRASTRSYGDSHEEHAGLAEAYAVGDVAKAIYLSSRQLARIARMVIGNIDPAYEPVAVRDSLAMATSHTHESTPLRRRPT